MKHIFTNMPTQKLGLYLQAGSGEMVGPIMTPSLYLTDIDADSTGTVVKMPRYPQHNWELAQKYHFAPVLFCPGHNFNTSFLQKNGENCCYQKHLRS